MTQLRIDLHPPEPNLQGYRLIYAIENLLRELIIARLSRIAGPLWYKERLPADIYQKFRDGLQYERSIPWQTLTPHHPIYYLDIGDLKKIIDRRDNWRDAFHDIYRRKDVLIGAISQLEPIRHKIAHNRKLLQNDISYIESTYLSVSQPLSDEIISECIANSYTYVDIYTALENLHHEIKDLKSRMLHLKYVYTIPHWEITSRSWWFDSDYLEFDISPVITFYTYVKEYMRLPRIRGKGHVIETWIMENNLDQSATLAENSLFAALKSIERYKRC